MKPQRIVVVLVEPPLPFGNASARWYYVLLRGLVERGHRVTAFASARKPEEIEAASALFPGHLRCFIEAPPRGLRGKWETLRRPYSYTFSRDMRRELAAELARGFSVLHMEQLWSGWLGWKHASRALVNVLYLSSIDLAGVAWPTVRDELRWRLTLRAERKVLRHFPRVTTITPRLTERVRELAPGTAVETIPFGVDLSLYDFQEEKPAVPGAPVVGLVGSFDWQPTFSAGERLLTRLWPEIRRRVPGARLQLVGRRARAALGRFAGTPGLTIHEDVPDVKPHFAATDVLLYPLERGSGIKVKVVESALLGVPVVTTREGIEGLPLEDGVHAGVAEDDAGLVERTVALLEDGARRERQRRAARAVLAEVCRPEASLDRVERLHAEIAGGSRQE